MPVRYLLDTNIASYIVKGSSPAVDRRLVRVPLSELGISSVTEGELRFGAARLPHAARLHRLVENFYQHVTILPWDSAAAQQYGLLRASLEREGRPMGSLDLMIAAHALSVSLILVTHDQGFRRIRRLRIEDWTKP